MPFRFLCLGSSIIKQCSTMKGGSLLIIWIENWNWLINSPFDSSFLIILFREDLVV